MTHPQVGLKDEAKYFWHFQYWVHGDSYEGRGIFPARFSSAVGYLSGF